MGRAGVLTAGGGCRIFSCATCWGLSRAAEAETVRGMPDHRTHSLNGNMTSQLQNSAGVRPSPGAAGWDGPGSPERTVIDLKLRVAAAGDGRTPGQASRQPGAEVASATLQFSGCILRFTLICLTTFTGIVHSAPVSNEDSSLSVMRQMIETYST